MVTGFSDKSINLHAILERLPNLVIGVRFPPKIIIDLVFTLFDFKILLMASTLVASQPIPQIVSVG